MDTTQVLLLAERGVGFLTNLAVCAVATTIYFRLKRRSVGLLAFSGAIGALSSLYGPHLGVVGYFVVELIDMVPWAVGTCMLLTQFRVALMRGSHQATAQQTG